MTTTGKGVGTTLSDIPVKFQVQTVGCFREGRYSGKLTYNIANGKKKHHFFKGDTSNQLKWWIPQPAMLVYQRVANIQ